MSTQAEAQRGGTRGKHRAGAVSVAGPRKSPLRWLPWAALLLMALLAAGVALIVTNLTDENDQPGVELRDDEVSNADEPGTPGQRNSTDTTSAPQAAPTPPQSPSPSTTAGGAGQAGTAPGASTAGTLRAGQTSLLPAPAGDLAALAGQAVTGQGVLVESVVADEGFWVGSSPTDRMLVYLTPEARTASGESPFQVTAGQRIDLEGSLEPVTDDSAAFGVDDAEGASQLQSLGHYIEATRVALR